MKNIITTIIFAGLSIMLNAQPAELPFPSKADAEKQITAQASIKKMLEEKSGLPMAKLKLVKTYDFVFSDYDYCAFRDWPHTACWIAFDYEGPKDGDGIANQYQVTLYYTRVYVQNEKCQLQQKWDLQVNQAGVTGPYTVGLKNLNDKAKQEIIMAWLETGKDSLVGNFYQVDEVIIPPGEVTPQGADLAFLNFTLKGKTAVYNFDRSAIIQFRDCEQPYQLTLTRSAGAWKGKSTKMEYPQCAGYLTSRSYLVEEEQKEYYSSYLTTGFQAIYRKNVPAAKPKGMTGELETTVKALYDLARSKGTAIAAADVLPFIYDDGNSKEEMMKKIGDYLDNDNKPEIRKSMLEYRYKIHHVEIGAKSDQRIRYVAEVIVWATYNKEQKGMKWKTTGQEKREETMTLYQVDGKWVFAKPWAFRIQQF